ncbi:MAG: alpha/beta hydrolase [Clostridia bacterium]|nr:alpha/beta hydrolase [Clostridia bacterium]
MKKKTIIGICVGAAAVIAFAALAATGALQTVFDLLRPAHYELKSYLVDDGETHPFALICPGGAYEMISSVLEGEAYAKKLNERGFHAFVLYYRVKKNARYPNPQDDLQRAAEEIMEHAEEWKVRTEGWSLWGSSAGGHLAASFCTEDRGVPKPSALILCYPVVTMGDKTHKLSRSILLGKDPDEELIDRLSVERHIGQDFPPTFVWYGTADKVVDPVNSRMLQAALNLAGVPCEAEEYEGIGHGVGLAEGTAAEEWFDRAVEFWNETSDAARQ